MQAYIRSLDLLYQAFEGKREKIPCVRLFLKGNQNLYKTSQGSIARLRRHSKLQHLFLEKSIDFSLETLSYDGMAELMIVSSAAIVVSLAVSTVQLQLNIVILTRVRTSMFRPIEPKALISRL